MQIRPRQNSRLSGIRAERPTGLSLIGSLQVFKAAVLLFTGLLFRFDPAAVQGLQSILRPLLLLALRGNAAAVDAALRGGEVLSIVLFLLGLYLSVVAFGLLRMHGWAQKSVLLTCGLTLMFFLDSLNTADTPLSHAVTFPHLPWLTILDAVIFAYIGAYMLTVSTPMAAVNLRRK